jgi:hypothetical protein
LPSIVIREWIRAVDPAQVFDELVEFLAFKLLATDGAEERGERLHDPGIVGDVLRDLFTGQRGEVKEGGLCLTGEFKEFGPGFEDFDVFGRGCYGAFELAPVARVHLEDGGAVAKRQPLVDTQLF